jgi:hypothetical protein
MRNTTTGEIKRLTSCYAWNMTAGGIWCSSDNGESKIPDLNTGNGTHMTLPIRVLRRSGHLEFLLRGWQHAKTKAAIQCQPDFIQMDQ